MNKVMILLSLILLVSCGKPGVTKDGRQCRTLEEQRAICYIEEMDKLGHDPNMHNWVINQCKTIYAVNGCY